MFRLAEMRIYSEIVHVVFDSFFFIAFNLTRKSVPVFPDIISCFAFVTFELSQIKGGGLIIVRMRDSFKILLVIICLQTWRRGLIHVTLPW